VAKESKVHYLWPLRRVVKVIRKGREHTDVLSCGHEVSWRGSSAWKQGENEPNGREHKRRCKECYAKEQAWIDNIDSRKEGPAT
jgi:hypothetical protein